MALTAYLAATNRLLQNPLPANLLYSTADLTAYINEGRQQLAIDAQCIRAQSLANLTTSQQLYSFSLFNTFTLSAVANGTIFFTVDPSPGDSVTLNGVVWTFVASGATGNQINITGICALTVLSLITATNASANPLLTVATYDGFGGPTNVTFTITYDTPGAAGNSYTLAASAATPSGATLTGGTTVIPGISSAHTIPQLAVDNGTTYKMLVTRPWPWFNYYYIASGAVIAPGIPKYWSQLGLGTKGSFAVSPVPTTNVAVQADCVCLPVNLVDDTTPEAIPYSYTDAVQYYAAYKAYLSSQKTQDATVMLNRYKEFVQRAIQESSPTVMAANYQGGLGAKIVATKQSLTMMPQGGGGQ